MSTHRSSHSPLSAVLATLGRAARLVFGIALLAGTALLGLLLLAGLLLRSLFKGSRGPRVRVHSAGMSQAGGFHRAAPPSRRPLGEVVDIEAREVGPTAR